MPDSGRPSTLGEHALVWYVTYGSNMHADRFACYISGGTPPGGARTHPGCRDPQPPRESQPVCLDGGVYFALKSKVWGGGMAFYDPALADKTAARGYLVTAGQFADIVAQEMHRDPDGQLDLDTVMAKGRSELGPGRYETLILAGRLNEYPMLTFTAPWSVADVVPSTPHSPYLKMLGEGLRETHGWDAEQVGGYLAARPGAREVWTATGIANLLTDGKS